MRKALKISLLLAAVFLPFSAFAQSSGNETVYSYGDGERAFVLRQSAVQGMSYDATLKMDQTNEVWILEKSQGARGAVLYRNDAGRVFLRVNHIGGATIYPTPQSMGVPVLKQSEYRFETEMPEAIDTDENLKSIEDWSRAYAYAGNKASKTHSTSKAVRGENKIEFTDWPQSKSAYKTELISHLSDLMENYIGQEVERIIVKIGDQPAAVQHDADLTIWVNPALGFAGRPSTEKILSDLSGDDG